MPNLWMDIDLAHILRYGCAQGMSGLGLADARYVILGPLDCH